MLVGVNVHFKIPIGYKYINGITSVQMASFIHDALVELHPTGVKVIAFTSDGLAANLDCMKILGMGLTFFMYMYTYLSLDWSPKQFVYFLFSDHTLPTSGPFYCKVNTVVTFMVKFPQTWPFHHPPDKGARLLSQSGMILPSNSFHLQILNKNMHQYLLYIYKHKSAFVCRS